MSQNNQPRLAQAVHSWWRYKPTDERALDALADSNRRALYERANTRPPSRPPDRRRALFLEVIAQLHLTRSSGNHLARVGLAVIGVATSIHATGQPVAALDAQGSRRLRLTEVASRHLPGNAIVMGGSISADGSLLVWDNRRVWLATPTSQTFSVICLHEIETPRAAAFVSTTPSIAAKRAAVDPRIQVEVVDAATSTLIRYRTGEPCQQQDLSFEVDDLTAAARSLGTWWFISKILDDDSARDEEIRIEALPFPRSGAQPPRVVRLVGATADSAAPLVTALRDGTLLVGDRRPPFVWVDLDGNVRIRHPADLEFRPDYSTADRGDPYWVTTGAFGLDVGAIQVVADLRSDSRILVRYNADGLPASEITLNVPLGVISTAPSQRRLIAARRLNGLEIVTYEWVWMDGAAGGSPPSWR